MPDGAAAVELLANRLQPGRRRTGQGVPRRPGWNGSPLRWTGGGRPVKTDPRRGGVAVAGAVRHPAGDQDSSPGAATARRSGTRARRARHQARHADHGRHRHHRRVAHRLLRRPRGHRQTHVRVRAAGAVPDDRPGRWSASSTTSSRSTSSAAWACAAGPSWPGRRWWARCSRCWCSASPTGTTHPGLDHLSFLRGLRPVHRAGALRGLGHLHDGRRPRTAVNLTDGLDGLATGAAVLVLAAYVLIGNWQLRNDCTRLPRPGTATPFATRWTWRWWPPP